MKFRNDVIIIGSGIGGLSCGMNLALNNYKVSIFEKLHQSGGYVNTFKRKEYLFESTIHQHASSEYIELYFKKYQFKNIELIYQNESYESIIFNQNKILNRFIIKSDWQSTINSFIQYFPEEKKEIIQFFDVIKKASNDIIRLSKVQRSNFPFLYLFDLIGAIMLIKSKGKSLFRKIGSLFYLYLAKYNNQSYDELLNIVKNPRLKFLLSQYCFYIGTESNRVAALVIVMMFLFLCLNRPTFIKGGSQILINECERIIRQNHGQINYHSHVKEILTKNNKAIGIKLKNGEEHYAKFIVSGINAHTTYHSLISKKELLSNEIKEKISNYKSSKSVFIIYIGLPYLLGKYGLHTPTTIFSNSFDINSQLKKIPNPDSCSSFILTNYSLMDPDFAPAGKSSFVITEYDDLKRWENLDKGQYQKQKLETQNTIMNKVKKITNIPFEEAEVCFSATPMTLKHYSGNIEGGIVGAELNIQQSILNRFDQITTIDNLYLVGADTQPAGSFISAFDSGLITSQYIKRKF